MTDAENLSENVRVSIEDDKKEERGHNKSNKKEECQTEVAEDNIIKDELNDDDVDEIDGVVHTVEELSLENKDEKAEDVTEELEKADAAQSSTFRSESSDPRKKFSKFAPRSLIDVPDYAYVSIDGSFQSSF
ncbi:uncharacterized protein LOC114326431 [Diabrotica virgifera virgifera]|uniref:Uncharacterized protein n=1 Tax=Diabrotica virgifera virgifera TaxID=50390 RepID=A0ABM5JR58_DIAVI|nr:uncharacterized protein LOC114326431 [Diabrotica virgifera virgifera]